MLNFYSIFVYYVLFYKKKLPTSQKTPHHFPAKVGSTPHTPPVWIRACLRVINIYTINIYYDLDLLLKSLKRCLNVL